MGQRVSQSVKQPALLARTDRGKRGRGRGKKRNLPRKDLPTNSETESNNKKKKTLNSPPEKINKTTRVTFSV